jgi:hypothetical protein
MLAPAKPLDDRETGTGDGADAWQYNLSAVGVPGQDSRNVHRSRLSQAARVVREQ